MTSLVFLVKGDDPTLRENEVTRLVGEVLDGDDRVLAVEEHAVPRRGRSAGTGGGGEERDEGASGEDEAGVLTAALTAAQSPPFLTRRRIVVLRDVGALSAAGAERVGAYVVDPVATTALVLVAGGGKTPPALEKALKTAGATTRASESEKPSEVLAFETEQVGLRLSRRAADLVSDRFGQDAGRVPELVDLLVSTFGTGDTLDADDVEPYLGEAGAVPPWELTGAIDRGDVAAALETLHRLLHATSGRSPKSLHPLQVMAIVVSHYQRMLRLDSPDVRNEGDAVTALGGKVKPFPAKKALEATRRLGTDGLREAFGYLAQADLDLRGATGVPEETVMEVLVARLAALSVRTGRSARPARPRR